MTLELVDSLNTSLQFQRQSTNVEKEQRENITAFNMCSNKPELFFEATSHKNNNQRRQDAIYPEGTKNEVASHNDTNNWS